MRVLNSTLILIFMAQSIAANEQSLSGAIEVGGAFVAPPQSPVAEGMVIGGASQSANIDHILNENMLNYSNVEYDALNWFEFQDMAENFTTYNPTTFKAGLVEGEMSPVIPGANDIETILNNSEYRYGLSETFSYDPDSTDDYFYRPNKAYSAFGGYSYKPCGFLGGDFTNEPVIVDFYDFGEELSNLSTSCREQLTEYSLASASEKMNSDAYCNCVDTLPKKDGQNFSKDTILNEFKDSFYKHLIAKRVSEFMDRLKHNAVKFQNIEDSARVFGTEVGSYGCNEKSIESIAKEIKNCFEGESADIIDKEKDFEITGVLNFLSDTSSTESRLKIVFDRANEVIERDQGYRRGTRARLYTLTGRDKRKREEQVRKGAQEFSDLFIVQYSQLKKDNVRMPDEYLEKITAYFKSSPLFRQEFEMMKHKYVDLYNLRKKTEGRYDGRAFSHSEKTIADISSEHEKKFAELFATIVNTKAIQSLVDSPNFKDPAKLVSALEGLERGDPASVDMVHRSMGAHLAASYEEEMQACEKEIKDLKYACNPENAQDVMQHLTAQEFVAVNDRVLDESNDDAISNSQMYCEVLDHNFIDAEVANASGFTASNLSAEKVFASVEKEQKVFTDGTGDSDKERRGGSPNIVNTTGASDDILNANNSNLNNPSTTTPSVSNDDDYNFSEAANLFDNINSTNTIPDSNVMDGNTLQSIVSNPSTSVDAIKDVKERVEDEVEAIEEELEKNEGSVSAAQMDENNALKEQLDALKAQIAELNTAITERDKKEDEEKEKNLEAEKVKNLANVQESRNSGFSSFGASSANNARRENAFAPQQASRASTGGSVAPSGSTSTAGSFSSAGQGLSAINKLGATGGLGLSASGGSARGASGTVSNAKIAQSDQRLVAEAISNGNTSVVLADGRVYYIGQDEEGNVILSETAEEVMAGVMGPEEEGPQLPAPKADEGPKREIASEKEETPAEESIYSKFLNAAEINE